jgi:hypothetical protein
MIRYFPIIILQIYLLLTLAIFQFGPISYYIEFPIIFWGFILVYHVSFFCGYLYSIKTTKQIVNPNIIIEYEITKKSIKIVIFFAIVASLMGMKQFSFYQLINPSTLYDAVFAGIINPGEQYTLKMVNVGLNNAGNKLFNIVLFFIVFSKVILIPILVLTWHRLSFSMKVAGIMASLLPVFSSISNGTNKAVFDFLIYYSSSLLCYFIYNRYKNGKFNFRSRKFFIIISIIALVGSFSFFGLAIGQRGGSVANIEWQSSLGHINLNSYTQNYNNYGFYWYLYTWFSNYLVQGYYGFSLSLSESFDSTFGLGNSVFFMRQFQWLTGIDLSTRTYQHKIDEYWDYSVQWHSFYAHYANDFHFAGVSIICIFLGVLLGKVWLSVLYNSNIFGFLLLPIFALLIIFIPANNQIFGMHETTSAFFMLFLAWFLSRHKIIY